MELILHIIGGIIVFTPLVMYILAVWAIFNSWDNTCRQDDDDDDDDDDEPSDRRKRSSKRRKASSRSRTGSGSSRSSDS